MENSPSEFIKKLHLIKQKYKLIDSLIESAFKLVNINEINKAYTYSLNIAEAVEKLALLTRELPAYTGNPFAIPTIDKLLVATIPVKIGFTKQGWFTVIIPALLPKKEKGSASYIRGFLYPAMSRFFIDKKPIRYDNCVLVFRHVYDKNRPERAYRDHDNIELNMVVDIIALYVLMDDSPIRCSHYYCSTSGNEDRTEIFVVPQSDFSDWLEYAKKHKNEEVILYENQL